MTDKPMMSPEEFHKHAENLSQRVWEFLQTELNGIEAEGHNEVFKITLPFAVCTSILLSILDTVREQDADALADDLRDTVVEQLVDHKAETANVTLQ